MTLEGIGRYQTIRLKELITDGRFNRPVREPHVRRLLSDFNARAFRVLEVWKREDGEFVILDGQHRAEAARRAGVPEEAKCIPALMHEDLTLDQAAELFVQLNDSKLVSAAEKFRALLTAGHSETCDIARIVSARDLRVRTSAGTKDGTIGAIAALREIYRLGEPAGAVLAQTLAGLHGAWGSDCEAYASALLKGTGLYFHEHRDTDPQVLAAALIRGPGGAINLIGWAKKTAGSNTMSLSQAIAVTIEADVLKSPKRGRKTA